MIKAAIYLGAVIPAILGYWLWGQVGIYAFMFGGRIFAAFLSLLPGSVSSELEALGFLVCFLFYYAFLGVCVLAPVLIWFAVWDNFGF